MKPVTAKILALGLSLALGLPTAVYPEPVEGYALRQAGLEENSAKPSLEQQLRGAAAGSTVSYEVLNRETLEGLLDLRRRVFLPSVNPEMAEDSDWMEKSQKRGLELLQPFAQRGKVLKPGEEDVVAAVVALNPQRKVVGYAFARLLIDGFENYPYVEIKEIAVDFPLQGQGRTETGEGIGTLLFEKVLETARRVPDAALVRVWDVSARHRTGKIAQHFGFQKLSDELYELTLLSTPTVGLEEAFRALASEAPHGVTPVLIGAGLEERYPELKALAAVQGSPIILSRGGLEEDLTYLNSRGIREFVFAGSEEQAAPLKTAAMQAGMTLSRVITPGQQEFVPFILTVLAEAAGLEESVLAQKRWFGDMLDAAEALQPAA